jgi:outer membrane protein TolC
VDLQAYELAAAQRTLAANIVIQAVNAASLAEALAINERLAQLAHEQADLTAKAYGTGAASHDDVLTAQQSAAALDAALPPLRTQALRARHALAVLMGRTPDKAPEHCRWAAAIAGRSAGQHPLRPAAPAARRAGGRGLGARRRGAGGRGDREPVPAHIAVGLVRFGHVHGAALFTAPATVWGVGASLTQPIFHGRALLAQRKAAVANYDASIALYQQTVLNAFQNVADCLTALNQDALALQAAQIASAAARQSLSDTDARYRLGALSYPTSLASEQRWQNATLTEIQDTASRLIDTAALFQAMGTPPE